MFNFLDTISGFLLRTISIVLRYILLPFTFAVLTFQRFISGLSINSIFVLGLINYCLSFFISFAFSKLPNKHLKLRYIMFFLSIIVSFFTSFFFIDNQEILIRLISFIVYFFLWKKGIENYIDDEDIETINNSIVISIILFLVTGSLVFFFRFSLWYFSEIKLYLIFYFIITFLYLARTSIIDAYNKKMARTVNKKTNIFIFNCISTINVTFFSLAVLSNFFGLGNLAFFNSIGNAFYNFIGKLLMKLLYPVISIFAKLSEAIKESFNINILKSFQNMKENTEDISQIMDFKDQYNETIGDLIINFTKWFVLIVGFIVIAYLIFINIKRLYSRTKEVDTADGEEKEFILTAEDIKKGFRKKLNELFSKLSSEAKKNYNNETKLPIIRRIYLDVITMLSKKGYEYKKYYTPNEYADLFDGNELHSSELGTLTNYYNKVRYGNKKLDEKEIDEASSIKNKLC